MSELLAELQQLAADLPAGVCPWLHDPCGTRVLCSSDQGYMIGLDGAKINPGDIDAISCQCGKPVTIETVWPYFAWWWLHNETRFLMRLSGASSEADRDLYERDEGWVKTLREVARASMVQKMWVVAQIRGAQKRTAG